MNKTEQELRLIVKCLPPSPFHDKADEVVERAIAELRRLRISQLRRMADVALYSTCGSIRDLDRWRRFVDACLAEIERLRGEE